MKARSRKSRHHYGVLSTGEKADTIKHAGRKVRGWCRSLHNLQSNRLLQGINHDFHVAFMQLVISVALALAKGKA